MVRGLSPEELAAFRNWFQEFDSDTWDRQIEADARGGTARLPGGSGP